MIGDPHDELAPGLVAPAYESGVLADVFPAAFAAVSDAAGLTVATADDQRSRVRLGLPAVRSVLVVLADGLGSRLLATNADVAPYLTRETVPLVGSDGLTVGFPTTTATSLASLGVGVPTGQHAMTGYQVRVPGTRRVVNALQWDPTVDPLTWQPHRTVLERAAGAGVHVTRIAPAEFEGSGLTVAALRGGTYVGITDAADRVAVAAAAQRAPGPCLTYLYHGAIDRTGHMSGCHTAAWRAELAAFDAFVAELAATVPDDGLLLITADHGMVDVDRTAIVDAADEPALLAGVEVFAGEARCRYLHARRGRAADVLAIWRDLLPADEFCVLGRDDAVGRGLFGPVVTPTAAERIGDVVVLARGRGALFVRGVDSRTVRSLIGQHGSLTPDEVYVPLLALPGADVALPRPA